MTQPDPAGGPHFDASLTMPLRFRHAIAGAVTTGNAKATFQNVTGNTLRILEVTLAAGTAPTGADLIVDVNTAGVSEFTAATRPRIVAGQKTGSAKPIDDPASQALVAPGQSITVDVDQIGSTVAGSDLEIVVIASEYATGGHHWKELRDGYTRPVIRQAELLPVDVNPA